MKVDRLPIDGYALESLARRWKIRELAVFGSVLREDFSEESDIDLLVSFAPDARLGLFDLVELKEELENLFGRKVDLVEKKGLVNPFRRKAILETAQIIYES
jgi:uncharacterized protein